MTATSKIGCASDDGVFIGRGEIITRLACFFFLILSGFQDQPDILKPRIGHFLQGNPSGVFQTFWRIFVRQLQKGQATFVRLFLHPVQAEELLHHFRGG